MPNSKTPKEPKNIYTSAEVQEMIDEEIRRSFYVKATARKRMMRKLMASVIPEELAEEFRKALRSYRDGLRADKKYRKQQRREFGEENMKKRRALGEFAPPLYPPEPRECPFFYNSNEVPQDAYEQLYKISTKVCISGTWYHANVKQDQEKSTIDPRLLRRYATKEVQRIPSHPNAALFSPQDWAEYHARRAYTLPLTFETVSSPWELDQKLECPTTCAVGKVTIQLRLPKPERSEMDTSEENDIPLGRDVVLREEKVREEYEITLGRDVVLREQANTCVCVEHYEVLGQTQGNIRLRDGTRVRADIKFEDSPAGRAMFKDLSENPLRYWNVQGAGEQTYY